MAWRFRVLSCALVVGLACAASSVLGCSSKEFRYPADHARFQRIDQAVEELRVAYVREEASDIQSLMLPLEALDRLMREIQNDFQTFQEISLDFTIERILIEGDAIDVFVHWQGQWKRKPEELAIRERGHGLLRLIGVQSILLNSVEGDLPFGMASRLAAADLPTPRVP